MKRGTNTAARTHLSFTSLFSVKTALRRSRAVSSALFLSVSYRTLAVRTVSLARALTWRSSLSSAAMAGVSVAALGSRRSKRVTKVHGSSSLRFPASRLLPLFAACRPLSLL